MNRIKVKLILKLIYFSANQLGMTAQVKLNEDNLIKSITLKTIR